ncbi:MAG TPA: family 1 glycosylhydrolase [Acidimicrobiales bacterium]|nr:family 1 glycosylhydrolase [Acidimicrobiales bacterium]
MADEPGAGLVPADFRLGLAWTGWEAEGGFNGPGQPADNRVRWAPTARAGPRWRVGDFWQQPQPTLDRAAAMGCTAFGLSVEWARLEPAEGRFDAAALDRYGDVLAMCRRRGLAPVVTLHHGTHPWWLGEEFWLTPGAPDRFAAHVARVVDRLAGGCDRWVTVDRPDLLAWAGWLSGQAPPGRRGALSDAWAVVDNLLTAHVLAFEALTAAQPDGQVAIGTGSSARYDDGPLLVDLLCARSLGVDRAALDDWVDERRAAHDLAVPPRHLADLAARRLVAAACPFGRGAGPVRGRLRRPSPRRVVRAVYDATSPRPLGAVLVDAADPAAFAGRCRELQALVPGLPLWATGAGSPADVGRQLRAVVAAVDGGVPLHAYLCRGPGGAADPSAGGRFATYGRLLAAVRDGDAAALGALVAGRRAC